MCHTNIQGATEMLWPTNHSSYVEKHALLRTDAAKI